MMKKVLFDGLATQGTTNRPISGGVEYAIYIFNAIVEVGYRPDIVLSKRKRIPPSVAECINKHPDIKVLYVDTVRDVLSIIDSNNYDVFYSALPMFYRNYHGKATFIGVIHGLRSVELPWDEYRYKYELGLKDITIARLINHFPKFQRHLKDQHIEQYKQLLANEKLKLIVVSNHTKYSLLNFYPNLQADNIKVFYSPQTMIVDPCKGNDYFLMVNGNRYEKNTYRAIQVFDKLFSDGRLTGKKVVITGCGKQKFFSEIKNKDRFDLKPYVSAEELEKLYKNAFCFVYPSLNEGFGYPPIKAMGYATPVIASSATSIPEVCGDAAVYFSPTNMDDMANRILQINEDASLRNQLCQKGLNRVKFLQQLQDCNIKKYIETIFE